jgi:hypothetical protein
MKMLCKKKLLEKKIIFNKLCKFDMSYYYHNFPTVAEYYCNGKLITLDKNFHNYNNYFRAFLSKRWINKFEIPPKIEILNVPEGIQGLINHTQSIPNEISPLDLDESILKYFYSKGYINRNYIFNILFEKNEINLYKSILNKQIMNGYVVKYFFDDRDGEIIQSDFNIQNNISQKIKEYVKIFFFGQELTRFEKALNIHYLTQKWNNYIDYKNNKEGIQYTLFTRNDMLRSKLFFDYKEKLLKDGVAPGAGEKNILDDYNPNEAKSTHYLMETQSEGLLRKILFKIFTNSSDPFDEDRIQLISRYILLKIYTFLESEEFNSIFPQDLDFYISQGILSMHLWLVCGRLLNFKKSKLAYDLVKHILTSDRDLSNSEFDKVDTLRKAKKFKSIEEMFDTQKMKFDWHFLINNPTVENNYFKIDSLVWTYVFSERIDRNDERVYKMSHYLIKNYHRFTNLTFQDFENLNFKFDLSCESIPFNYKDAILYNNNNYNLSPDEIFNEQYSDFKIKKYSYDYMREIELEDIHQRKTFIRFEHRNLFVNEDSKIRSRRVEDTFYDELKDEERIGSLKSKLEHEEMYSSGGKGTTLCDIWTRKHFGNQIETCEMEDRRRDKGDYNINGMKYLENDNVADATSAKSKNNTLSRFSENLPKSTREKLYIYRDNLKNNPKSEAEYFKNTETKLFYPDANVTVQKMKKKILVDRIFKL